MHAVLRSVRFDPDPSSLPADPNEFAFLVRLLVGPHDGPGEESFDLTVCSPEWISTRCDEVGLYDARHHLIVRLDDFDQRALLQFLTGRVHAATGNS